MLPLLITWDWTGAGIPGALDFFAPRLQRDIFHDRSTTSHASGELRKLAGFFRIRTFCVWRPRHSAGAYQSCCKLGQRRHERVFLMEVVSKVIVLQGVFGTIPAAAQSFTTMCAKLVEQ